MQTTSIEWTDLTVNPIRANKRDGSNRAPGHYCEKISPGCKNCYSSKTQPFHFGMPEFQDQRRDDMDIFLEPTQLHKILRRRKPAKVFWCDMTDLLGDWVPDEWIDQCFAVMALTPHLTHQILTKRAKRMRKWLTKTKLPGYVWRQGYVQAAMKKIKPDAELWDSMWPLPNAWMGFSAEDQESFDERWAHMQHVAAAGWLTWCSAEPLLGPLDVTGAISPQHWEAREGENEYRHREDCPCDGTGVMPSDLRWVVVGGESGPGARPFNADWALSIVQQCRDAGVACFVKQLGAHVIQGGERRIKRDKKGGDPAEWPHDLRVREFPDAKS